MVEALWPPATLLCSWTLRTMVVRSKPENGIFSTASMPAAGSSVTGFCGTVSTITETVGSVRRTCSATCIPETRPCSSASTIRTSGRSSLDRGQGVLARR